MNPYCQRKTDRQRCWAVQVRPAQESQHCAPAHHGRASPERDTGVLEECSLSQAVSGLAIPCSRADKAGMGLRKGQELSRAVPAWLQEKLDSLGDMRTFEPNPSEAIHPDPDHQSMEHGQQEQHNTCSGRLPSSAGSLSESEQTFTAYGAHTLPTGPCAPNFESWRSDRTYQPCPSSGRGRQQLALSPWQEANPQQQDYSPRCCTPELDRALSSHPTQPGSCPPTDYPCSVHQLASAQPDQRLQGNDLLAGAGRSSEALDEINSVGVWAEQHIGLAFLAN